MIEVTDKVGLGRKQRGPINRKRTRGLSMIHVPSLKRIRNLPLPVFAFMSITNWTNKSTTKKKLLNE